MATFPDARSAIRDPEQCASAPGPRMPLRGSGEVGQESALAMPTVQDTPPQRADRR